jgi:hypothetical protein
MNRSTANELSELVMSYGPEPLPVVVPPVVNEPVRGAPLTERVKAKTDIKKALLVRIEPPYKF